MASPCPSCKPDNPYIELLSSLDCTIGHSAKRHHLTESRADSPNSLELDFPMTFVEQLQALAIKTEKLCPVLETEEATKNALVLPLIHMLGYDIFDPMEVVPEFTADVGIKKGEKVDYAVKKDGKIIMLFECKHCGGDLNLKHASQLFRYFAVTDARIGVLTNGIVYQFYTDLEAPNRMDEKPFLEVSILDLSDVAINELQKLSKQNFDVDKLIASAGDLKFTRQIKKLINQQIEAPTDEFVKLFASKVYNGMLTPARRDSFKELIKRGFRQVVNERVKERFQSAMSGHVEPVEPEPNGSDPEKALETTAEELEGYYIVKSLLRDLVDPKRIVHRDTQSYMGILLDDNNRKPLARLHFNRKQKYLGIFNEQRNEERVAIANINEIYEHAEQLRRVFAFYESETAAGKEPPSVSETGA
jgi:predicted type IV restriction endonuclease